MANQSGNPKVTIAGAGVAGLAAAHRLLERGYDVTLLEADAFFGGKLGAHRDIGVDAPGDDRPVRTCPACAALGGCLGQQDWHEHCYHMYLNWYHNFWALMDEVGTLDNFHPASAVYNMYPRQPDAASARALPMVNVGSPWTLLHNIRAGVGTPLDTLLWGQALLDLAAAPERQGPVLERTSVTAFMQALPYATEQALAGTYRTTAQAFASPSYLSSARSYRALLSYGLRAPEPSMWLLTASTEQAIFAPWLAHLARSARHVEINPSGMLPPAPRQRGHGGSLTVKMLTPLQRIQLDRHTGRVTQIEVAECAASPSVHRSEWRVKAGSQHWLPIEGDLILALPPDELGGMVRPDVAERAPELANVRYLRCEPMMSIDLFFKRRLAGLPQGITVLLDSRYQMSFLDTSQTWRDLAGGNTVLNVVASDVDTLAPAFYTNDEILPVLLDELRRYIAFTPATDLFECRTHLETNVGERLFVNQVGSWQWRPETTCSIPNLYIAGDHCKTVIDVVTIEGAVVSGLMAAEAVRRRRGHGRPINIRVPDQYPVAALATLAAAQRPFAYLARGLAAGDAALRRGYRQWFPNG
jgi:predicted NAD/FAD-dependent oxidoreductase